MTDAVNLYAPPKAPVEDVSPAADEAQAIRKAHIKTEMAIRSIGVLYCIGGLVASAIAVALLRGLFSGASDLPDSFRAGLVGVLAVGAVGSFFLARGLLQLREWARITTLIFAAISVLEALAGPIKAPLGAIINACFLYLLLSRKGRRIFASDYPQVIAATPSIGYKMPVGVWIGLGLLVLFLVAVLGMAMLADLRAR